jgi:NAD(P)-dependent dehydrogenase (short-subunit alcohol dehydrogenase family)
VVVNDYGVSEGGAGGAKDPADEVVEDIKKAGGQAVPNYDSVATMAGGQSIIMTAVNAFGRVDIVVNNAGILRDRMIFNMSEEEWDAVIAVHLKGHYNTIKPASVLMRQQRYGRIVNFSSISGLRGISGQSNYGAAKAGIAGLTRVVARDLGRYGVTCNAIAPGAQTRMTATVPDSARQLRAQRGIAAAAPPRPLVEATPEHVAPMVVYLCTDEAWNVNGKIFHVAGGAVSLASEETAVRQITKDGKWELPELVSLVPAQLMFGVENPAPPPPDLDLPGRPAQA